MAVCSLECPDGNPTTIIDISIKRFNHSIIWGGGGGGGGGGGVKT